MRTVHAAVVVFIAVLVAGAATRGADSRDPMADPTRSIVRKAAASRPEPTAAKPDRGESSERVPKVPSAAALRAAGEYAAGREGVVSFAVVNTDGELRGVDGDRLYPAASVVKSMLLAAEIRQLKHDEAPIDSETDSLLRSMITASDNSAADAIYARVGDAGLNAVATRAGMTRFTVAGHWGNAQIAAGDMALFFADLDRQFPRDRREYAEGLLGSVIESQRWGIPVAAGDDWAVRLKGGWLPDHALVHQAAELRERNGSRALAIVVLTDEQPSFAYGVETVQGTAARLLSRDESP